MTKLRLKYLIIFSVSLSELSPSSPSLCAFPLAHILLSKNTAMECMFKLSVLLFCSDLTQRSLVIFPIIKGLIKNRSVMGLHLLPYPDTAAHSLLRTDEATSQTCKTTFPTHTDPDTLPSLWPPSPLSRYNYAWNSRVLSILNISSSYTNLAPVQLL